LRKTNEPDIIGGPWHPTRAKNQAIQKYTKDHPPVMDYEACGDLYVSVVLKRVDSDRQTWEICGLIHKAKDWGNNIEMFKFVGRGLATVTKVNAGFPPISTAQEL
jgi:hypothetical protein